jgi:prevent-host-death family protein
MAAQRGWSVEETEQKLLEVSEKARERARCGDESYARITTLNAGRGGRGRPQAGQRRLIRRNTIDSTSTELYISCKRNGEFMASLTTDKNGTIVVSALKARTNFGKLLRRVEDERRSLVIEKRGTPKAVLLSIRDYVKLAAPEPEVLKILGEESERKGTSKLTARQIDQAIKAARAAKPKR